jgi:hypothetical protein
VLRISEHKIALLDTGRKRFRKPFTYHAVWSLPLDRTFRADIIAITRRMDTVAKRLTRNAAGSTYWKKAAIAQAGLLDKMLDVAKASENDQLIAAVRKCFDGWADGNPHYRAALDSGMSITDCLALVLAGKQPDQNVPANLSNHPVTIPKPVTTTNNLNEPAANES